MRFTVLGSGSKGNATLVENRGTHVLVDCGFSARELDRRLARAGCSGSDIDAVLVTHEHGDHIKGAGVFGRRYGMPVYMTHGTSRGIDDRSGLDIRLISTDERITVRDLEVKAYAVPHDAHEPCQYVFSDGDKRLGILSDLGRLTRHVLEHLDRCDALLLESNHDTGMLAESEYPDHLKQRIAGNYGHLSNEQAAQLLTQIDQSRLQHIAAIHLSEKNNSVSHVIYEFSQALDCSPEWIGIAGQESGLAWRQIQ